MGVARSCRVRAKVGVNDDISPDVCSAFQGGELQRLRQLTNVAAAKQNHMSLRRQLHPLESIGPEEPIDVRRQRVPDCVHLRVAYTWTRPYLFTYKMVDHLGPRRRTEGERPDGQDSAVARLVPIMMRVLASLAAHALPCTARAAAVGFVVTDLATLWA